MEFGSLWGHVEPDAARRRALIDHGRTPAPTYPTPSDAHVHVNRWLMDGLAPSDGRAAHIVLAGFSFTPAAEGLTDTLA